MKRASILCLGLVACGGAAPSPRPAPPRVRIVGASEPASETLHRHCDYLGLSTLKGDQLQTFATKVGADHALPLGGRKRSESGSSEVDNGVLHRLHGQPRYETITYDRSYASNTVVLFHCGDALGGPDAP